MEFVQVPVGISCAWCGKRLTKLERSDSRIFEKFSPLYSLSRKLFKRNTVVKKHLLFIAQVAWRYSLKETGLEREHGLIAKHAL